MAYKLPRGKCPWCGVRKALKKDGRLHAHNAPAGSRRDGKRCDGSGQRPS